MKEEIQLEIVQIAQKILTSPALLDNSDLLLKELHKLYERALIFHFLEKNLPEVLEKNPTNTNHSNTSETTIEKAPEPIISTSGSGWNEIRSQVPEKDIIFEQKNTSSIQKDTGRTLNDSIFSKQLQIGLNDRIAFVTHLFNGSIDEYNKTIAMINNLHTPDECWDFILHKVKPSYNNWQGKEEYEDRFFYIISKRFG